MQAATTPTRKTHAATTSIEATTFLDRARSIGLSSYAGVPCSLLGSMIDAATLDETIDYVGAANEGDAVAIAAGGFLGGRRGAALMQNSGLGNAVSPVTSLTYPFRIPVLLLVTLRGDPDLRDEPQHELMGVITYALLEQMKVPWADFPRHENDIDAALARADDHLRTEQRPYALVVRKGSLASSTEGARREDAVSKAVAGVSTASAACSDAPRGPRPTRGDALRLVVDSTPIDRTVVIATTGYTGRELFALDDRPNHFYMVGSMGCASALGLGLARARPDLTVVVVDGDGAALMRMGNLATVGAYGPPNLVHILLDNGVHDSTGGQATVAGSVSFSGVAAACGYTVCPGGDGLASIEQALAPGTSTAPRFADVRIRPGTPAKLPRPTMTPHAVRERLMAHIGSAP